MYVIGTAGHVDHGKSSLVQALSGINPDRLAEEQRREMTIDLGFAWLTLPSGREISIVDVPGHEDFIKNMLAGVGGIDVALLVVAADEGVMPQTREHLAILDLLDVSRGVVALTKADMVEDEEWLELVADDLRAELASTSLAQAPIVPVSSKTGRGLDELQRVLDALLDETPEPADLGKPRLPIDRVFSIAGFGTVVTGTLMEGSLEIGAEMQIVPGAFKTRIRGLQSHKTKVDKASPGSRVAVNLTGVNTDELRRGQVLTIPGNLTETRLVDASLRMLEDAPLALQHSAEVFLHTGSESVLARVRLLDAELMEAGQSGWVQFRLEHPIACARHDRYVIRLVSPSYTLGGGQIVEPSPARRHRRMRDQVVEQLATLAQGDPQDVMRLALRGLGALPVEQAVAASKLSAEDGSAALQALYQEGALVAFGEADFALQRGRKMNTSVMLADELAQRVKAMQELLAEYHRTHPLSAGMPREDLRSRVLGGSADSVDLLAYAAEQGAVQLHGTTVALSDHKVALNDAQQQLVDRALDNYRDNRTPPSMPQLVADVGTELAQLMLDRGQLVRLSDEVVFDAAEYRICMQEIVAYLGEHQRITVAEARDLLSISRRLALALLEHLDQERITKRVRDFRVLR